MKYTLTLLTALLLASRAATHAAENGTDRFGGSTAIQRDATGSFRVEQGKGRWMLATPEGHGCFAPGLSHASDAWQGGGG